MDYEKKYKEALELARVAAFNGHQSLMEGIFPELAESEDRIRKDLLGYLHTLPNHFSHNGSLVTEWVAWLEKQENHANFCNKIQIGDKVTRNRDGVLVNLSQLNRVAKKDEKQSEQKLIDKIEPKFKIGDYIERKDGVGCHAKIIFVGGNFYGCEKLIYPEDESSFFEFMFENQDEFLLSSDFGKKSVDKIVESKFKVGDWIIYSNEEVHLITGFDDDGYFVDKECYIPFNCEGNMRLWTIQDAKDGDVLATGNKDIFIFKSISNCVIYGYCGLYLGKFMDFSAAVNSSAAAQLPIDYVPATKEQRDTLMKAMTDAGYTFDFEKKELKKIERKSTWIEEDEKLTDVNHEYFSELLENNNSKNINDYAYQVAYCMSHDWAIENPTWDDVQKACKLGAEWNGKRHKSTWSEEDEKMIIKICQKLYNYPRIDSPFDDESFIEAKKEVDWLNSLKDRVQPQNQWKPTEEQMRALDVARCNDRFNKNLLNVLYNELKKLYGSTKENISCKRLRY